VSSFLLVVFSISFF